MSINHIATNLVTKGLLNMSNITKGMIIIGYEIIFKKGSGGSGDYAGTDPTVPFRTIRNDKELFDQIKKHDNIEDIDIIKVKINWKKKYKGDKSIDAKLIKSHIEAEILKETGKNITVEIIN